MEVKREPVRTTWLELPPEAPLRAPVRPRPAYELRQVGAVSPEFCRFLYTAVGYRWNWTRRLPWSYADWEAHLRRAGRETWVAWMEGAPGGYFELTPDAAADQAAGGPAETGGPDGGPDQAGGATAPPAETGGVGSAGGAEGVEITQFGVVPRCFGRGLGGHLLCDAARRARELGGGGRVWLHTCTADHPHALPNYKARGFRPVREAQEYEEVQTAGEPWPGAGPVR